MTVFYIILLVLSFVALTAELITRSAHGVKNFGWDKRWFNFHGSTIPIEDFFPHDVTETLIMLLSLSVFGLIQLALGMPRIASVFCGVIFAMLVIFGIKHLALPAIQKAKGIALPKDKPDVDDKAVCTQRIAGDDYGEIEYTYKRNAYRFPAMSANETESEEGEEVTVVHKEDGMVWVEKIREELEEVED